MLQLVFLSSELYEFCLKENIADANLIAKWKKQGYENLCCLRCIQTRDTNFGTSCICRVPKAKLEEVRFPLIDCCHYGLRGIAELLFFCFRVVLLSAYIADAGAALVDVIKSI